MAYRQIFLLYMPPGNSEAMVHYEDTIIKGVALPEVAPFVSPAMHEHLSEVFMGARMAVWGSQAGPLNRTKFERMRVGDEVLIVEGDKIKLIGLVAAKVESPGLSRQLWKPLQSETDNPWELIYFIANRRPLNVSFERFNDLFGYKSEYRLRGFTAVSDDRLAAFYGKFDDLYDVLVRLSTGFTPVHRIVDQAIAQLAAESLPPDVTAPPAPAGIPETSEHVRMQWKLASMGRKAGERIWIPVADQKRIKSEFDFSDYDTEFAPGIDVPYPFVKNIDVVWKHEFRIDAAYEIENSTAIYSGLLRFADLTIVAPNTLYPLFIVAPGARKGQVREQLRRPAFQQLRLADKVSFLSYEAVDEVDRFFGSTSAGLSVEVLKGRAEKLL